MTKVYNKLVRDKIPEIIKRQDEANSLSTVIDDIRRKETKVDVKYRILEGEELRRAAVAKLIEEAQELLGAKTFDEVLEEIADIYEVFDLILHNACGAYSMPIDEYLYLIESVATEKALKKGRFDRHVFLEEVSVVDRFDKEANNDGN